MNLKKIFLFLLISCVSPQREPLSKATYKTLDLQEINSAENLNSLNMIFSKIEIPNKDEQIKIHDNFFSKRPHYKNQDCFSPKKQYEILKAQKVYDIPIHQNHI